MFCYECTCHYIITNLPVLLRDDVGDPILRDGYEGTNQPFSMYAFCVLEQSDP